MHRFASGKFFRPHTINKWSHQWNSDANMFRVVGEDWSMMGNFKMSTINPEVYKFAANPIYEKVQGRSNSPTKY